MSEEILILEDDGISADESGGRAELDEDDYKCGVIYFNKASHLLKYKCQFCPETYDNINFYCDHMSIHLSEDDIYNKQSPEDKLDGGESECNQSQTGTVVVTTQTFVAKPEKPKEKIAHITISLSKCSNEAPTTKPPPSDPQSDDACEDEDGGIKPEKSSSKLQTFEKIKILSLKNSQTSRKDSSPNETTKASSKEFKNRKSERLSAKEQLVSSSKANINSPKKVSPIKDKTEAQKAPPTTSVKEKENNIMEFNGDENDFEILDDSSSDCVESKNMQMPGSSHDPLSIDNEELHGRNGGSNYSYSSSKLEKISYWRLQALKALSKKQTEETKPAPVEKKCMLKVISVKNDLPDLYKEIAGLEYENTIPRTNDFEKTIYIDGQPIEASQPSEISGKILKDVVEKQTKTFGDCLVISLEMHTYRLSQDACPACDKKFRSLASLTMHLRSHHLDSGNSVLLGFQCDICKLVFSKRGEVHEHMPQHFPNGFKCLLCRRNCTTLRNLTRHLKFVHLSGRHACKVCKKFYCGNRDLRKHNLQHHPPPCTISSLAKFSCRRCFRKYETMEKLESHIAHHNESVSVDPDICEICGKVTLGLREHQKVHIPKPAPLYFCTACKTHFKYNSALSNHLRRIHNSSIKRMKAGKLDPSKTITIKYRGKRPNYKRKYEHDYANNDVKKKKLKSPNEDEIKEEENALSEIDADADAAAAATATEPKEEYCEYVEFEDCAESADGTIGADFEVGEDQDEKNDKLQMLIEQCEGFESMSGEEADKALDYYYENIIEEDFEEDSAASNIVYEETISYVSDQSIL